MSNDKKYTAQEAALAVLKKAEEMLLAKGQSDGKHADNHAYNYDDSTSVKGVNKVVPVYEKGKGVKHGGSEAGQMARKAATNGTHSDGARARHEQTLGEIKAQPKPNIPGAAPGMAKDEPSSDASSMGSKGVHKLSKFVGRLEGKKGSGTDPLANEIPKNRMDRAAGYKERGDMQNNKIAREGAIESHREKLSDIKAQPKPNLTKAEESLELAKQLHTELMASSPALSKAEGEKAPGSYGNVTPHTDHVGMASMKQDKHYDLKHAHKQNAAIATAKGDHELAGKHAKMADMHHAYQSGIVSDHKHIEVAGKMHSELSAKKDD